MGLGLHAAYDKDFRTYELNKLPAQDNQIGIPIEIVPTNAPPEVVDNFKTEFATWIIGCGLREMLEHYSLALDVIHKGAILVLHVNKKLERGKLAGMQQQFERIPGLPRKLRELEQRTGISPKGRAHIDSLYTARNCLTHGAGLVGENHTDDLGLLKLRWRAFEVFTEHPEFSGQELIGRQMLGITFSNGGEIKGRFVEREKLFHPGEKLRLTQQDLWEICHFFSMECIPSILDSTIEFANRHGVRVNRKPEKAQWHPNQH